VTWYRKAAEQGHVMAQLALGGVYQNGKGVPRDPMAAYTWYKICIANGYRIAEAGVEFLIKEMAPEQIAKAEALAKEMIAKNPNLIKKP